MVAESGRFMLTGGINPARSEELKQAVTRIIYDPQFLYRHQWREGDLLVWDNRLLHHARSYYDNAQNRVLRRCAIADPSSTWSCTSASSARYRSVSSQNRAALERCP